MSNKIETCKNLYYVGIRDGKMHEAMEKYTGKRYVQHSTGVKEGKAGFIEFFEDFVKRCPKRDIKIVRAIEDGKYIFMHVYQNLNNKSAQWVTMDMFNLDENDKIIEHWDVIDAYIEEAQTISKNDMIFGDFKLADLEKTQTNKILVRNFLTSVFQNKKIDDLNIYVSNTLIQHNPKIDNGINAYKAYIKNKDINYDFIFKILGQGNYVVAYSKVIISNRAYAVFDVFRIENQMIVEHWDNLEVIPEFEELTNTGKF